MGGVNGPCYGTGREALSARALELTILTAVRTSEALQASWSEFDLSAGRWIIPADRMKAGKEHRVPRSPPALELLESLPRVAPFVFPGLNTGKPLSSMAMEMVLSRMEVTDCTVHGFRSSLRDLCGEKTAFPRDIAEMALAHAVGAMSSARTGAGMLSRSGANSWRNGAPMRHPSTLKPTLKTDPICRERGRPSTTPTGPKRLNRGLFRSDATDGRQINGGDGGIRTLGTVPRTTL